MGPATFGPAGPDRSRELATLGPQIEVVVSGPRTGSGSQLTIGLIDTGASVVCIDRRIALGLGLQAVDLSSVLVPGGTRLSTTIYLGRLDVPELGFSELTPFHAPNQGHGGFPLLLGRSFLKHFVMTYDGPEGLFHFFRPDRYRPPLDDDYAT